MNKKTFKEKIFETVRKIPRGRTLTYKQVAALSGRPMAYRAVGNILKSNYDPAIPCHRVVRSDGQIGGYNRGPGKKRELLENEAIEGGAAKAKRNLNRGNNF